MRLHQDVRAVTDRIIGRSSKSRARYIERCEAALQEGVQRGGLGCSNLAHGMAACPALDKQRMAGTQTANLGIITSYNDMLSAHQPYETYPAQIKEIAREAGAVAQVAGGVPAMCDGVTQGTSSMDISLMSRDVIAMATAIGLSHNMFDAAIILGVCDKIVPGLVIGALSFGHLPAVFIPAGPMPTGSSNDEKSRIRQLYAKGEVGREALLEAEAKAYHSPGTCTFYGTANTNQMLMEIMGLHMPGSSFVNPGTTFRDALTREAVQRALRISITGDDYTPLWKIVDEKAIVNGVIGLLATGGSTNHTMHLVAMAAAAGIQLTWQDFSDLSACVPLLARVYPNGKWDVNHFQMAGGMGFVIKELLKAGLLHEDVQTIHGTGLDGYAVKTSFLEEGTIHRAPAEDVSPAPDVLTTADAPFSSDGGLKVLCGNLGTAIMKVSAVPAERRVIEAPARVFTSQADVERAFKAGEFTKDVVVVVRFLGPKASGMPEAHKLTPILGVLQARGLKVALVTDGRMSGASGSIPAAIHVTPEALDGGPISKIRDGDIIRVDGAEGKIEILLDDAQLSQRSPETTQGTGNESGSGRELFHVLRAGLLPATLGAITMDLIEQSHDA